MIDRFYILLKLFTVEQIFGEGANPVGNFHEMEVILPEADELSAYKSFFTQQVAEFEAEQRDRFLGNVHHSVIAEWREKGPAAIAHLSGAASAEQTAVLQGEASMTGETIDDLAAIIAPRYQAYLTIGPKITGMRRNVTKLVNAAETPEAVEAVFDAAMAQARTAADQIAQALGVA